MTVSEILRQAGEYEDTVLKTHATLLALSKISRYEAECALFEVKYNESLDSFGNRIQALKNHENFSEEDDLMDWQFASRARQWWSEKLKELGHVD